MKSSAPNAIHLALDSGRPYLFCDGSVSNGVLTELPSVEAAFELTHYDLLGTVNRPLVTIDCGDCCYNDSFTYLQFRDMIRSFGFKSKDLTIEQMRILFYYLPIFKHAYHYWSNYLLNMLTKTGSVRAPKSEVLSQLVNHKLVTVGVVCGAQHIMLTPTGARLAVALRVLVNDLLTDATPGQYISDDLTQIAYHNLWVERQGNVQYNSASKRVNLDKLLLETL